MSWKQTIICIDLPYCIDLMLEKKEYLLPNGDLMVIYHGKSKNAYCWFVVSTTLKCIHRI